MKETNNLIDFLLAIGDFCNIEYIIAKNTVIQVIERRQPQIKAIINEIEMYKGKGYVDQQLYYRFLIKYFKHKQQDEPIFYQSILSQFPSPNAYKQNIELCIDSAKEILKTQKQYDPEDRKDSKILDHANYDYKECSDQLENFVSAMAHTLENIEKLKTIRIYFNSEGQQHSIGFN